MNIENALTIDVEDYFHVSAFEKNINKDEWDNFPSRVEYNTRRLLDVFDERDLKATFFVLGWVAEREPELVRDIAERGHEVACHGYSHQLVYNQSKHVFREETLRSKSILEDLVQQPVLGYRAASYSITEASRWALDVLVSAGFSYDSSIFPIRHDRYGIPDAVSYPHAIKTLDGNSIVEFPLSTATLFGLRFPVAGGGYFRLYPYSVTKAGLSQVNRFGNPFIFYLHPWEIDPEQPRIKAGLISRFRHYNNLNKCEKRLHRLMEDFKFCPVIEILRKQNLLT